MRASLGKGKYGIRFARFPSVCIVACLLLLPSAAYSLGSIQFSASPVTAATWISGGEEGFHSGFEANAALLLTVVNLRNAAVQAGAFGGMLIQGSSNWLSNATRYRGWIALSFGPALRLAAGNLALQLSPALNLSRYQGTWLYTAYWSCGIRSVLYEHIGNNMLIGVAVPLEFAWRAGGMSAVIGIGAEVRLDF
ncbi:MAG: hypothetical protein QHH01_07905 [Spirochaetales bacterium]|nr:hypothetical protein [Spirochaetales bacterium]